MEAKKQLRKEIARKQAALTPQETAVSDAAMLPWILELPEYQKASLLFCYVSMEKEPDTRRLIAHALAAGKRVAVPLCTGKGQMEAREIAGMEDLIPGQYGILEPKAACPMVTPREIRLAVIPCVTCGHNGKRLGHGGGYYDRYLAQMLCPSVCLCREALTCEEIPLEPHDLPVGMLITEQGVFDFRKNKEVAQWNG